MTMSVQFVRAAKHNGRSLGAMASGRVQSGRSSITNIGRMCDDRSAGYLHRYVGSRLFCRLLPAAVAEPLAGAIAARALAAARLARASAAQSALAAR